MTQATAAALRDKACQPCEGGTSPLTGAEAERLLQGLGGWGFADEKRKLRRQWTVRDFRSGMDFLSRVADLAEAEGHHPDVHLTGYRNVTIELTTHAIGGLSENDFILAAKIDNLPVSLKERSR